MRWELDIQKHFLEGRSHKLWRGIGETPVAGAGAHGCGERGRVPPSLEAWSLCPPVAGLAVSEARALAPSLGPWLQNLRTHHMESLVPCLSDPASLGVGFEELVPRLWHSSDSKLL